MQDYQKRVVDECEELEKKLYKLLEFSATPTFAELPDEEKERLLRQRRYMSDYALVLRERIEHFLAEVS